MSGTPEPTAGQLDGFIAMMEANRRAQVDHYDLLRRFPSLADVVVTDREITGRHGPVPARVYRAAAPVGARFVWVHGGAFVAGDLDMYESHWVALELAARGIAVVALDYRKALGGVHHPVLSDDVLAGWTAAATDGDLLGEPAGGVHLGGASAGGNLAVSVAMRARDGQAPAPESLVLVYPNLHETLPEAGPDTSAAAEKLPAEMRFSRSFMSTINLNYVGSIDGLRDPLAFPALGDLTGLPETYILNAEADDLRASGEAFASDLATAGVPVRVEFEPDTRHGYLDQPDSTQAARTIERVVSWLTDRR